MASMGLKAAYCGQMSKNNNWRNNCSLEVLGRRGTDNLEKKNTYPYITVKKYISLEQYNFSVFKHCFPFFQLKVKKKKLQIELKKKRRKIIETVQSLGTKLAKVLKAVEN